MATGLQSYRPAGDETGASEREALVLEHLPQVCLIAGGSTTGCPTTSAWTT
jgi:hypothetical protein